MIPLEERFERLTDLLTKHKDLYSQFDEAVFSSNSIEHPWIKEVIQFSTQDKVKFDCHRDGLILQDRNWRNCYLEIQKLSNFPKSYTSELKPNIIGKEKKQHEFSNLYNNLGERCGQRAWDFGGGVGNLSHFLETHLKMNATVIEKDPALISKGKVRLAKHNSNIDFINCDISASTKLDIPIPELAIGLHTCGNFATDMMRLCTDLELPEIINMGCCYSKIQKNDYSLNKKADKSLLLNERALGFATLGFQPMPEEFYHYRNKIIDYKMSYYNYIFQVNNTVEFHSMSNSRRSLYDLSFHQFMQRTYLKYHKKSLEEKGTKIDQFYQSPRNQQLLDYLKAYYSIARYFGEAIEAYIICDRALFLKDSGYRVEIKEIFNPKLSPRNKGIFAVKA